MAKLEDYQCENLFLLVGENPLPNYVAAKMLAKKGTRIYFVYSPETQKYAKRLENKLGSADFLYPPMRPLSPRTPAI